MAEHERLLPPPLSVDGSFRELARLANDWPGLDADLARTLAHIANADPVLLQHYAEWFSLSDEPAWSLALDDGARRLLAAGAVMLRRRKGTPWAVRRVLELVGFGGGTRLIEGGAQKIHDGTVAADGSRLHGGAAWAEYSVEADLGETAGLESGTGLLLRRVLGGIAPARCHLADVLWRADLADTVNAGDAQTMAAGGVFEDMPARPRYDGAWRHDAAVTSNHDGALLAGGAQTYQGWRLVENPNRHGAEDSELRADIGAALEDRAARFHLYNGTRTADGSANHGDDAPACVDEPMTIRMTRVVRYNGNRMHTGVLATGDIVTFLEAA